MEKVHSRGFFSRHSRKESSPISAPLQRLSNPFLQQEKSFGQLQWPIISFILESFIFIGFFLTIFYFSALPVRWRKTASPQYLY